jgi:hypothetical protein
VVGFWYGPARLASTARARLVLTVGRERRAPVWAECPIGRARESASERAYAALAWAHGEHAPRASRSLGESRRAGIDGRPMPSARLGHVTSPAA